VWTKLQRYSIRKQGNTEGEFYRPNIDLEVRGRQKKENDDDVKG